MIFVGDLAIAKGDCISFNNNFNKLKNKRFIVNLEGAITEDNLNKTCKIYNSKKALLSISEISIDGCFIGTNHIHDITNGIEATTKVCQENNIGVFGAGMDISARSVRRYGRGSPR